MGDGGGVDPVHDIAVSFQILKAMGTYQEQMAFCVELCGCEFGGHGE